MERENVSLSVDVLRSKTPLLQLPINESLKNSFWKHVINNTDWALYKEQGSKNLEFQFGLLANSSPSSETQGQSVGPGEKARRKFSSTGGRAPGYLLSPDHFQTVKRILAPDWAQNLLCVIVPNRQTVSFEFFS